MSITDELREVAVKTECANGRCEKLYRGDLEHIADRIDAEHKRAIASVMNDALYRANEKDMAELGWIRLPKDAEGEYIHIGDTVTCARSVWEVTGLRLTGLAWGVCCTIFNDHGGSGTNVYPPCDLRHYHVPTVEDVLREFAYGLGVPVADSYVAATAAKLRLAEGEDA